MQTMALSLGAGWASGINLYAAVLVLGLMGATGGLDLPEGLELLSDPLVLIAAGTMYAVEFFTDKIPGIDTLWDSLHTFVRIPAGAMLAAGALGDAGVGAELAAMLMGGGMAAGSHAAKAGTRVMLNTSPEPFTNWTASVAEDLGVFGGLWLALTHPALFLIALTAFVLLLVWLLPRVWRGIRSVFGAAGRLLRGERPGDEGPDPGQKE